MKKQKIDSVEHQNQHFQSISEEYYRARQDENHLVLKELLFGKMLKDFRMVSDKVIDVLEPMCGYGEGRKIVSKYITKNINYEGFDYSDILIEKVIKSNPEVNIYKQDVTTFKAARQYDVIILIGGLHHVPQNAAMVCKNLCSALRPGGLFINFEPTNNNLLVRGVRSLIYKKNHIFDEETEKDFSLKELNRMYNEAGFTIKKQFYPGLLAYILYYNPDAFPGLNLGKTGMVKRLFAWENRLYSNFIGKFFSFCTFSVLTKV